MPARKSKVSRKSNHKGVDWKAAGVHTVLIASFGAVISWHFTDRANKQEVVTDRFGWFFQYYTFAGFTLQLIQFVVALAADLTQKKKVMSLADDISCAAIPVASFITAFYYCLLLTGNIVDSDEVPSWVSPALHTGNFAGLLLDLVVSRKQRTFRTSSSLLSALVNLAYIAFLYYTRVVNGSYPYAFLESMSEPLGIIVTALILVTGVEILFLCARKGKERFL